MTASTPVPREPGPLWTAAAVARELGVAPATLRSWGRRYGIGPAGHTPGHHRRYSESDVAELRAMRALVEQGMVLSTAAALVRSRRIGADDQAGARTAVPGGAGRVAGDAAHDLARAAERLDLDAAGAIVAGGLQEHGVVTTWDQLCRPAFADLAGAGGADGGLDAELALGWAITTSLRRPPARSATAGRRGVLLACAPGERHTLALEALAAALAERRVPVHMLGPTVPATALRHAAQQRHPEAVVVWAQRDTTAELDVLGQLTPHTDVTLAAGPGWLASALPPAVVGVNSLTTALAAVEASPGGTAHAAAGSGDAPG